MILNLTQHVGTLKQNLINIPEEFRPRLREALTLPSSKDILVAVRAIIDIIEDVEASLDVKFYYVIIDGPSSLMQPLHKALMDNGYMPCHPSYVRES